MKRTERLTQWYARKLVLASVRLHIFACGTEPTLALLRQSIAILQHITMTRDESKTPR